MNAGLPSRSPGFGLFGQGLDRDQTLDASPRNLTWIGAQPSAASRPNARSLRCTILLTSPALADQGKGRPQRRIGVSRRGFIIEEGEHGLTQRLARPSFGSLSADRRSMSQVAWRLRNRPPDATPEARERRHRRRIAPAPRALPRLACRRRSCCRRTAPPISIEFQLRDFARGEQAIVEFDGCFGMLSTSEGSATPLTSPATRPWVAK